MTSRRLSRLRALLRSTACVLAVVGCALGATGCDPSTSSDAQSGAPSIESGPADLVDSSVSDSEGWTTGLALFSDTPWLIATASGPVAILRIRSEEYSGPNDKTVLAALDPQDGSLRWSLTITPAIESLESSPSRNQSIPQRAAMDNIELVGSPGPVVTSPNGQYISLQLNSNESSTIAGTRAGILVLDAATGETVRTLETTGLVLGQALTDSDLFVQTAQDYVPAGSGTLAVAPLDEPEAEPSTLRTDQWLVGATADVVINIQGDEPFIRPEQIEQLKHCFDEPDVRIATLAKAFDPDGDFEQTLFNPNTPKVAFDVHGDALYFSRSIIPYIRGAVHTEWLRCHTFYKHIGLYAYRAETLRAITLLPQSSLEKAESLEQLRWLENGYRIRVAVTPYDTVGIDTPDDLARAVALLT